MQILKSATKSIFNRSILRRREDGLVYIEIDQKPTFAERVEMVSAKVEEILLLPDTYKELRK